MSNHFTNNLEWIYHVLVCCINIFSSKYFYILFPHHKKKKEVYVTCPIYVPTRAWMICIFIIVRLIDSYQVDSKSPVPTKPILSCQVVTSVTTDIQLYTHIHHQHMFVTRNCYLYLLSTVCLYICWTTTESFGSYASECMVLFCGQI